MIDKLASRLTCYIENNSKFNKIDELEQIKYALVTVLNEVFKITTLIVISSITGSLNYLLFSLIILLSIRPFSGGLHSKTLLGCLLWSTLFFTLTSTFAPLLPKLNLSVYYILSFLILLIIIVYSPFPNEKRPIKNKKRKQYLKILAVFSSLFWSIYLIYFINNAAYLNCGIATTLLLSLQLLYKKKETKICKF